ncbi:hypothetical protein Lsan_1828 [Legionella santicrucis]|uniref:Transmembrane protein n=1 Tax=Legionella santicrucis TaxID=45074 RepID=A0A0W0YX84_9GAMM|nr:hypothetical protein Lsan_1828 [Legionella santicrucis]
MKPSFKKQLLILALFPLIIALGKLLIICTKKDPVGFILIYLFLIIPFYSIFLLISFYSTIQFLYFRYYNYTKPYKFAIIVLSIIFLLSLILFIIKLKIMFLPYKLIGPHCYVPLAP